MTLLGPPETASFRLVFAQGFNGIATVVGPLIASRAFFNQDDTEEYSLGSVQYVYLAMACLGLAVNIGFFFAKLPEVKQVVALDAKEATTFRGFLKNKHTIWGFFAEFAYTGAQVAVASNVIFYLIDQPGLDKPISKALASDLFSACQAVFTVGRFLGLGYLKFVDPSFALFVHGVFLVIFSILTSTIPGIGGIVCLFFIFLFESICYPVIFSVATSDLGIYAKLGSGFINAGVSGGAAWPAMQSGVADRFNSHISFLIPMAGFVPLMVYGFVMWYTRSKRYNNGKLTIWITQPPLDVDEGAESAGAQQDETASRELDDTKKLDLDEKVELQHIEEVPSHKV